MSAELCMPVYGALVTCGLAGFVGFVVGAFAVIELDIRRTERHLRGPRQGGGA